MVKRGSGILPDMTGRAIGGEFHIGQKPVKNGAQARVEIALQRLLEEVGQQESGADEEDDGHHRRRKNQPEGK